MLTFKCGDTFPSYAEFEKHLHAYQNQEKVLFIKGNCKKILCESEEFRSRLVYDFVVFVCKQGKRTHQPESKGIRPRQRSFKKGCEARIKIITKKIEGNLVLLVTLANLQHSNHPVNAQTYSVYPENRRTGMVKDDAITAMIKANTGTEELKRFIFKRHGTLVLSRDIQNFRRKILRSKPKPKVSGGNELEDLVKDIETDGGWSQLSLNEDGNPRLLIFRTKQMREDLIQFPNILIIDVAQGVNSLGFPLLSILCMDSNGCCRPVLHAFLSPESQDSLTACLKVLKEICPDCGRVFFINRDFVDTRCVEENFPRKIVKALSFHALPCVRKALHKHSLPSQNVNVITNLFKDQRDAQSYEKYMDLVKEISMKVPQETIQYFSTTWWNCPELWASHKTVGLEKLQMYATRKIEGYQLKIKAGKNRLNSAASLSKSVKTLIAKDVEIATTRDTDTLYSSIRSVYEGRNIADTFVNLITNHLTSFSSELVIEQLELREKTIYDIFIVDDSEEYIMTDNILPDNQYTVKIDQCSCDFCACLQLPCHHIFALRQYLELPLYEKTLSKFGRPSYNTEENNQGNSVFIITKVEPDETQENQQNNTSHSTYAISRSSDENLENVSAVIGEINEHGHIIWPAENMQAPSKMADIQDGRMKHLNSVLSQINECLSRKEPKHFYKYLYQLEKFLTLIKDNKPLMIVDTSEADVDQQHRYVPSETSLPFSSNLTTGHHDLLPISSMSSSVQVKVQCAPNEKDSILVPVSNVQAIPSIVTPSPSSTGHDLNTSVVLVNSVSSEPIETAVPDTVSSLSAANAEQNIAASESIEFMSLLDSQSLSTNRVFTVTPQIKVSSPTSNAPSISPSQINEPIQKQGVSVVGRNETVTVQKTQTNAALSLQPQTISSGRKRPSVMKMKIVSTKRACTEH